MEREDDARNWMEPLRDEILPFAAFYALGLLWLTTLSSASQRNAGVGFAVQLLTWIMGVPITAMVSLMMLWRVFTVGVDAGRFWPMVATGAASIALLTGSLAGVFPALAQGDALGRAQQAMIAVSTGFG